MAGPIYIRNYLKDLQSPLVIGKESTNKILSIGDTDGIVTQSEDSVTWRDEYPSGIWVPAAAQASPDLEIYVIGGVSTRKYSFNGTNTAERISNNFEIPHDMILSSTILPEFHAHFSASTSGAGTIKLFIDWNLKKANNGAPIAQTSMSLTQAVNNEQYHNKVVSFGTLPDLGFGIGDLIDFTIRREPSDPEDTYEADVILCQVAMHVPCDTNGSRQRYIK